MYNKINIKSMKPTIYLGLGGTGNLAISFAKRLYEEEYGKGNIPDSIAFVTVDFQTDMDEDPSLATNISDDFIKIVRAKIKNTALQLTKANINPHIPEASDMIPFSLSQPISACVTLA